MRRCRRCALAAPTVVVVGLAQRHAGDAVDVAQARHQAGHVASGRARSPSSVMAGAEIAPRSEPLPPPPPVSALTLPLRLFSVTSAGMARDEVAQRLLPVEAGRRRGRARSARGAWPCASKSAYGFSLAAGPASACWRAVTRGELGLALLDGVARSGRSPAMPATQAARTPRTTKGPAPPEASGRYARSAVAFEAPRRSGGRRLTALTSPDIGTPHTRLEARGAPTLGSAASAGEGVEVPVDDRRRPRTARRGCPRRARGRTGCPSCGPP